MVDPDDTDKQREAFSFYLACVLHYSEAENKGKKKLLRSLMSETWPGLSDRQKKTAHQVVDILLLE